MEGATHVWTRISQTARDAISCGNFLLHYKTASFI